MVCVILHFVSCVGQLLCNQYSHLELAILRMDLFERTKSWGRRCLCQSSTCPLLCFWLGPGNDRLKAECVCLISMLIHLEMCWSLSNVLHMVATVSRSQPASLRKFLGGTFWSSGALHLALEEFVTSPGVPCSAPETARTTVLWIHGKLVLGFLGHPDP